MPIKEICVTPTDKRSLDDEKYLDSESKAMLQNLGGSYPVATQNGSPPSLSSPSSNYDICRICHCEAEIDAPLIAPCYCAGSLLYVHQSCLQQWIKSSDTRKCELCKFEFIMQTKIKPFTQWEKLDITTVERRKIFCSVTFHVVAITCVVWSLYVLIDRTAEEVRNGTLEWPFWTKLIVVAIGFTGGLVFMYVQCKMYVHLCRRWKAFNRIIFIQNAPTKAMMAAAMNDSVNLGNVNCSSFNSVQVLDHPVVVAPLSQPLFSPTKCETILTTTETVPSVVTCIEMTPSRFGVPETKVVTSTTNATYSPISPVPPSTVTLNLPLLVPASENAQVLNNSLVNNNNNNNDNNDERNLEAISQHYSNNCQLQMEKVS